MKTSLRKGSYADLNLYFLSNIENGLLGICRFPTYAPQGSYEFIVDGYIVLSATLPKGLEKGYSLGGTAIHEIGHYEYCNAYLNPSPNPSILGTNLFSRAWPLPHLRRVRLFRER